MRVRAAVTSPVAGMIVSTASAVSLLSVIVSIPRPLLDHPRKAMSKPGASDYLFAIIQCRKASASAFDPKWKLSTIG